jgi:hypothetical protein
MGRRSKPYFLEISTDRKFDLSASEWDELLAGGWAEPIPDRIKIARLVPRVAGWIRGCDLYLLDLVATARIRSVSASWAHAWLYRVGLIPASAVGETRFERESRMKRELDEALWIDAFLWRTSRKEKTKGANSLVWIDAETKSEIFRAFGLEMKSPPIEDGLSMMDVVGTVAPMVI